MSVPNVLVNRQITFSPKIITGDEKLRFQYDPETERQTFQCKQPTSPRPQEPRMSNHK